MAAMERTVGQVAEEFGVTVRTLHHYDDIGLVVPSERSLAGYRLYTDADVQRLSQVVLYRRIGLPLEQIREVLDGGDIVEHLRRQQAAVLARIDEMTDLVTTIETMLEAAMNDRPATEAELKEIFGDGFSEEYQQEAEERWGDTQAWAQSQTRAAAYTTADWTRIKADMDATTAAFVAAMAAGEPPRVRPRWTRPRRRGCTSTRGSTTAPHSSTGASGHVCRRPSVARTYDDIRPGLAQYVRDAIHANADRTLRTP